MWWVHGPPFKVQCTTESLVGCAIAFTMGLH
jgi:hypothetical protein